MASSAVGIKHAIPAVAAITFVPRSTFPALTSLPRSYFLGHHKAGLERMKNMVNQIDLVIECRDYRIPLTSRNPLLEDALQGKERIIVYTKRDLGVEPAGRSQAAVKDAIIRRWHSPTLVHFSSSGPGDHRSANYLLSRLKKYAESHVSLTGHRILVAGMPNVGKSTLLNALRAIGVKKGKAAKTGAQPGVTRKIGSAVKILDRKAVSYAGVEEIVNEGIYVLDTPGVFMPYVPQPESMLKLALCGAVKDSIIPPITLADYLLFRLNLNGQDVYTEYTPDGQPTNDIMRLLQGVAQKTGRIGKGGTMDVDGAAVWIIQRWRGGFLGKFVLDEVTVGSLERVKNMEQNIGLSFSQARKRDKEAQKARNREHAASTNGI